MKNRKFLNIYRPKSAYCVLLIVCLLIIPILNVVISEPVLSNEPENIMSKSQTRAPSDTTINAVSQWDAQVLASYNDKTSGCTIGDLDSTRTGNEIVSVNGDGHVAMIYQESNGNWQTLQLWQGQGELITPVIADFYADNPGNELVVVGMAKGPEGEGAGQATMIYGSGDNWKAAIMYIAPHMLHGLAVGDLDPNHPGSEVITMSFGYDVEMLTWNGTTDPEAGPTDWTVTHMWHGEGKVRKGVIDDLDLDRKGNELVVVDKSGNCTMLYGSGDDWTAKTLWKDPGTPGLARVTVGEVETAYPGKEIVVGGDSSNIGIIRRVGDDWDGEVIFTDIDKIRGVGISDVDPTNPGNEILVFGYSKRVTLLTKSGDNYKSRTIFTDTGRSHDLAVGDADSTRPGMEIIVAGYSKNITMLSTSPWFYQVLASYNQKTSGCTIGDLDTTRTGNEIVSVNGDGHVAMIYQESNGNWQTLQLWQGQGELITPVIADFYPKNPGNELVVVGMAKGPEGEGAGQATMIYGSGDNWNAAIIYIAPHMLHGLAVGDLDPNHVGNEIITMSFGYDVEMLTWNGTDDPSAGPTNWTVTHMWHAEGKVRKGVIDDVDLDRKGNELVVVDKSGNCTMIYGSGTNWTAERLWKDPGTPGLARITVGDVDPSFSGKEIVVGGDSNNIGIIRRKGNAWDGKVIFSDSDKIRGVGIADVDPVNPGKEILVFGYSKKVTMLTGSKDSWQAETIFTDTGRSHDLAIGECFSAHDGSEIIVAGYSKNITMIFNSYETSVPDFNMYAYPLSQTGLSGTSVEYTLGLVSLGGFGSPVQFSTSMLPDWVDAEFYPSTVIPDSSVTLTITIPYTDQTRMNNFKVIALGSGISHNISLSLLIQGDTTLPQVTSTIPVDLEEDVPILSPIIIKFNEPMDKSSITEDFVSIIEDETNTEYVGTVEYIDEFNLLMISDVHQKDDALKNLPNGKLINVILDSSISDAAGNALGTNYKFSFITGKSSTPDTGNLEIKSVFPNSDMKGTNQNSPIVIEFSQPIDSETLNFENIKIVDDDGITFEGDISYDDGSMILTISNLEAADGTQTGFSDKSIVTITLTKDIETKTGKSIAEEYSWSFTVSEVSEEASDTGFSETLVIIFIIFILIIIIIIFMVSARTKAKDNEKK